MTPLSLVMDPSKVQLLSEKIVTPSSPTPHHLKHYNLCYLDQLMCRKFIPMTLFYPHNKEKQAPLSINLEKSLSDVLSLYYPYAGRLIDNKIVDCNDEGAIFSEARIPSSMSNILKMPFSKVEGLLFQKDLPWSEAEDSLANARITHFECGGKAVSLCLSHKLGDFNTLADFLLHWSALARGLSFKPPQLIGSSFLPPNDDPFTKAIFDVIREPHSIRRFEFDVSNIERLVALVASQSDVKNATKAEIVTAFMNSSLARVNTKIIGSFSPFTIYIPLNFRKLISPDLSNLMGNFLSFFLIDITDEDDLKLPRLVSKIRMEKIRHFKKYRRLSKDDISSVIGAQLNSYPTGCPDLRIATSLCDYPVYDIDFGWGKPSRMTIGALPIRNTFVMYDTPEGGVVVLTILDKQIMPEFLNDEKIMEFASLDPSY